MDGGVDLLLVETVFDSLNSKAALFAIEKYFEETGRRRAGDALLHHHRPERAHPLRARRSRPIGTPSRTYQLLSIGINCALGPKEMRPVHRGAVRIAGIYVSAYPNAGLAQPDVADRFPGNARRRSRRSSRNGPRTAGSTSSAVAAAPRPRTSAQLAEAVRGLPPRVPPKLEPYTRLSGLKPLTIRPETNFVNIGERTNVTGSPKFAKLILAGNYEAALTIAKQQVENGAQIIDVNMDEGMLDSEKAMTTFLNLVASEPDIARVPVMIDSSKWSVIEAGLKCLQGKGVVNSISLKEGEEKFMQQAQADPPLRRGGGGDGFRRTRPGRQLRAARSRSASAPTAS